jgi:hypothetical protein
MLSTLRSLANAILGKTGKPDRVDTTTRMAMDADFSHRGEPSTPERESASNVDQIEELMIVVREPAATPSQIADFQRAATGALGPLARIQFNKPEDDAAVALAGAAHGHETVADEPLASSRGSYPILPRERGGDGFEGGGCDCDADHWRGDWSRCW